MMQCPAPGCSGKRKVEQLLCKRCWSRLPAKIRAELFRYWRASERQPGNEIWWSEYRRARHLAFHWFRQHPVVQSS